MIGLNLVYGGFVLCLCLLFICLFAYLDFGGIWLVVLFTLSCGVR